MNVALSRARGLAVLVASPALLRVACRSPEEMRLVNAFCRFVEVAAAQAGAVTPAAAMAVAVPVAASPGPGALASSPLSAEGGADPSATLVLFPELDDRRN